MLPGRSTTVATQIESLYAIVEFKYGENWRILSGKSKLETFESELTDDCSSFEQPFDLHFVAEDVRGWPRIVAEVWSVDNDGRHAVAGYGTLACPFAGGEYLLEVSCWRPKGTWFDNFVGAHSELQHKSMLLSSLNRYGLKTTTTGKITIELKVLAKDFQLHGVIAN